MKLPKEMTMTQKTKVVLVFALHSILVLLLFPGLYSHECSTNMAKLKIY